MSDNQKCPNCGQLLEVNEGYVTWCDKCYWNIDPELYSLHKKKIFDFAYDKISKVSAEKLYNEILHSDNLKYKLSLYSIFAYLVSAFIYLISFYCIYLSFQIFNYGMPHTFIFAILLFILGIAIFPKFPQVRDTKLERWEYPNLYRLIDQISDKIKSDKIDHICVNVEFNAFFTTTGIKRKNLIILGIPYFTLLDIDEKISVITHEIAHCKNKDTSRHRFVFLAYNSLVTWYHYFIYFGETKILLPLTWPLSLIVKMLINLLGLLLWRGNQKAEYFADYYAAKVAGIDATISASQKFYYHPLFINTLKRVAELVTAKDLFNTFRNRINNVPDREILRVKTIEQLETTRIRSSHPPTHMRNQFITSKVTDFDKLELTTEDISALETEFTKIEQMIEKRLLSDYREYFVYR